MKPYGRHKKVTGGNDWKIDYHMHEKGKKVKNWWEDMCCFSFKKQNETDIEKRIK